MSSTAAPAPAAASSGSFWESIIDIFYQPSEVFRRRLNTSVWPPMLFDAIVIGVIVFATFNVMQPIFDGEFTRSMAKAAAKNPQLTQEMMDKSRGMGEMFAKWIAGPGTLFSIFILGVVAWLLGQLVGAKQTFHAAMLVTAYAYLPRVLGAVINAIEGLLMDPAKLTSIQSISLSPARFLDPDKANPLLVQLLTRIDVITIWVTVLLAIGLYVTGRVTKGRAVVFGFLIWFVGSLPALWKGYTAM
jgi:Yip1-like protein